MQGPVPFFFASWRGRESPEMQGPVPDFIVPGRTGVTGNDFPDILTPRWARNPNSKEARSFTINNR